MPLRFIRVEDIPDDEIPFFPAADFVVFWDSPSQGAGFYQTWVTVLVQERATINLSEEVEFEIYIDIIDFRGTNRHSRIEHSGTYTAQDLRPLNDQAVAALANNHAELARIVYEQFDPTTHDIEIAIESVFENLGLSDDEEPPFWWNEQDFWENDDWWESHSARS
ncbi:hypothetical protein CTheo_9047 [Ceratobasidium theobromae]|uniref:DUF402 domain-containing protein n=1 Tax=Ceratobasidium theobromae TaxID=1582974 RepID=A0A5N5Q722_9AGAM|nr:hypothetical protein CTheo_9047 [Ceratobasidium theobromae]